MQLPSSWRKLEGSGTICPNCQRYTNGLFNGNQKYICDLPAGSFYVCPTCRYMESLEFTDNESRLLSESELAYIILIAEGA
jgi:hypothetical protein